MKSYLQKYLFNAFLIFLCLVFLAVIIVFVSANIYFSRIKHRIEDGLSAYHSPGVTIAQTFYAPPRTLILKGVAVKSKSDDTDLIRLKEAGLHFSLKKILFHRQFEPTRVYLIKGDIDYAQCSLFLKENPGYIKALLARLPDLKRAYFFIRDCRFVFPECPGSTYGLLWNNIFLLEDGLLSVRGSLGLESIKTGKGGSKIATRRKDPLLYRCLGFFTERGFEMKDLEIRRRDSYVKLSGVAKNDVLKARGLASIANFFGTEEPEDFSLGIRQKIKDFILSPKKGLPLAGPVAVDLNIIDLKCLARYAEPNLYIEEISFMSQGVPYFFTGNIGLLRPFSWNLVFSLHAGLPEQRRANPKSLDLIVDGMFDEGAVSGEVCLDFLREAKNIQSPDKFKVTFDRVRALPVADKRLKVDIESVKLSYITPSNEHFLVFDDFNALCDFTSQQTKILTFGARISDGLLKGKAFVDTSHFPFKNFFTVEMADVSADKLDTLLLSLRKVKGKFKGEAHYRNDPKVSLFGNITVKDGYLDNFEFFSWLSKLFRLPPLTKVDFDSISTEFLVDDEGASIKDIKLNSDDITLKGYLTIYEEDLVSSKLSLGLARGLLEKSPKFRTLFKLVGEDFSSLDFDFQLSGAVYAMNFQWSESNFKRNLRRKIPDFIERGIERKIERIIESISSR